MGSKADKRAVRLERALWREFCDVWVDIGRAADREIRDLQARKVAPGPGTRRMGRRNPMLMAMLSMALIGCQDGAAADPFNGGVK